MLGVPFSLTSAILASQLTPQTVANSALSDALKPALEQVGAALTQVRIDRWKVSRDWKAQLRGDSSSIQQDLSSELPALFHAAQQSPSALSPQLAVVHNIDALYDVLVRIATAASLSGGKTDARVLNDALQRLESARKVASGQMIQAASARDQEFAQYQAAVGVVPPASASISGHPKTIVVDNRIEHRAKHVKPATHRKTIQPASSNAPAPSSGVPQ